MSKKSVTRNKLFVYGLLVVIMLIAQDARGDLTDTWCTLSSYIGLGSCLEEDPCARYWQDAVDAAYDTNFERMKEIIETHDLYTQHNEPDNINLLCMAVYAGHKDSVEYLLNKGADSNKRYLEGVRPLHAALYKNNTDLVYYLIERGADIHKMGASRSTALHSAAGANNKELVEYFLKQGLDPNAEDSDHSKPADYARDNTIRALLLAHENSFRAAVLAVFYQLVAYLNNNK